MSPPTAALSSRLCSRLGNAPPHLRISSPMGTNIRVSRTSWLAILGLILAEIAHAQVVSSTLTQASPSETIASPGNHGNESNQALIRLVSVDRFAFGGIGFTGLESQGEADYDAILSRPSALAEFETIYLVGNSQAKAYALVGLHQLNLDRYRELAEPLRHSTELVLRQRGCLVWGETMAAVIRQIDGPRCLPQRNIACAPRGSNPSVAAAQSPAVESRSSPRQSCTASHPDKTSLPDSP